MASDGGDAGGVPQGRPNDSDAMAQNAHKRTIVYSSTLGMLRGHVVGRNGSHYLVRVAGVTMPVPKELVFELEEGWDLQGGRLTGPGGASSLATCPSAAAAGEDDG